MGPSCRNGARLALAGVVIACGAGVYACGSFRKLLFDGGASPAVVFQRNRGGVRDCRCVQLRLRLRLIGVGEDLKELPCFVRVECKELYSAYEERAIPVDWRSSSVGCEGGLNSSLLSLERRTALLLRGGAASEVFDILKY